MALKILATADLHLGKRSSGLSVKSDRISAKHVWQLIVEWAIQNSVDVLLLCGDVIDQNNRYFEAIGPLQEGFDRLEQEGITVFMVSGNHDYDVLPQIMRSRIFSNVYLLGSDGRWEVRVYSKGGQTLQFVGWSYPHRVVQDNPIAQLNSVQIDPNIASIGLLHADVDNLESRYCPVSLTSLQNTDVGIWLLGHIHKPCNFLGSDKIIRYPGSPQALSAKETGNHGLLLLTVDDSYGIQVETIALSTVRYENLEIDISRASTEENLRTIVTTALSEDADIRSSELENVLFLVYDIQLVGLHQDSLQILGWTNPIVDGFDLQIATGATLSVRSVSSTIRPIIENLQELARQSSPAGMLAQTMLAIREDRPSAFLDGLISQWDVGFRELNGSGTYQPLHAEWQRNGNPRVAKEIIFQECNRLLSKLLVQSK